MFKILITEKVSSECSNVFNSVKDISVDVNTDWTPETLKDIIGDYDALIVRNATKVTRELIGHAHKLRVIGRAGSGVDNIDLPAATDAGIIVMNTPGGNTVSTAELAFSLIMSLSRYIPQADRSLKEGKWNRHSYTGVELRGKVLGIIGLGNVGRTVAQRAAAFGMKIVGYDPFLAKEVAQRHSIELATMDEIWEKSDYITIHTPLNDQTRHLINRETLAKCRDGVRLINCARGGIIDESALMEAIESGKVAGAALDVFETEPPGVCNMVVSDKIICTPHLGASTYEAQDIVAVMIAEQIRDFLASGEVRNAVNMPSMASEMYSEMKPYIDLCKKMGMLLSQLSKDQISKVDITYYGELLEVDTWLMTSSCLEGLFTRGFMENVNLLNAISTAEKLGVKVHEIRSSEEHYYKNCIELTMHTGKGKLEALGTVFGKNDIRVVKLMGYEVDFVPAGPMLAIGNKDIPGVVGKVGMVLGTRQINIAQMTLARNKTGSAMIILNTDNVVDKATLDELRTLEEVEWAVSLELQ